MNGHNGSSSAPPVTTVRSLAQLFHRFVDLLELQVALFKVDAQEGIRSLLLPAGLLVASVSLVFGSVIVLLMTLAAALWEGVGLSGAVSLLIAGVAGLLLAAGAAWLGWHLAKRGLAVVQRSSAELHKNVLWLKDTLTQVTQDSRVRDRIS